MMRIIKTVCLWLNVIAVQSLLSKGLGKGRGPSIKFQCASSISAFETFLFLDVHISSSLDANQLRKLEHVILEGYNTYTEIKHCDLKVRRIEEVEASNWAKVKVDVFRVLLRVIGICRGCSADDNILAPGNTSALPSVKRGFKKKTNPKSNGIHQKTCSCSSKTSFGIPSPLEFKSYLQTKASSIYRTLNISSIREVDAQECAEERSFEAIVEIKFISEKPATNVSKDDIQRVPIGFKTIYNLLQEGSCDEQFRTVDEVVVRSHQSRYLFDFPEETRKLQVSKLEYVVVVSMALQGRCRSCPKKVKLFNDAIKRRNLQVKQPSSVCFCPSGDSGSSSPPSTNQFTSAYTSWLQEERSAKRISHLVGVNSTAQVIKKTPSPTIKVTFRPSEGFDEDHQPTKRPTKFVMIPSKSPMIPSLMPQHPSMQPSASPTEFPSSVLSLFPSSFNTVCVPSDGIPSPYPRPNDQVSCLGLGSVYEVLFQHFEDCDSNGWTNAQIDSSGSSFSHFLGRYKSGNAFPRFSMTNINATMIQKLFFSFSFYEIDEWEGFASDTDTLSLRFEGDFVDTIKLGSFIGNYSEVSSSGNSTEEFLEWTIKSDSIESSPQGFSKFMDQKHRVSVGVPFAFFALQATVNLTISWRLVGFKPKSVGIDDFLISACVN